MRLFDGTVGRILSAAVLLGFGVYLVLNISSLKPILDLKLYYVVPIFVGMLMSLVLNGIFTKIVVEYYNKRMSFPDAVVTSFITSVVNFIAPAGSGLGFRGVYLKKKYKLSYSDYVVLTIGIYVIVLLVAAVAGVIGLLALPEDVRGTSYYALLFLFCGIFISMIVLLNRRLVEWVVKKWKTENYLISLLHKAVTGSGRIFSDYRTLGRSLSIVIGNLLIGMIVTFFIMKSLGIESSLVGILLYTVVGSLAMFINITPGNIGIKEGVFLIISGTLGLTNQEILSMAVIERGVTILVLAAVWIIALTRGVKFKSPEKLEL